MWNNQGMDENPSRVVTACNHALVGRRKKPERRPAMVTGRQIRAARVLLGWSYRTLAERSGVSESTIRRAEATDGIPTVRADNLYAIQAALQAGGVLFIDENTAGGEGVRMRSLVRVKE